MAAFNSDGGTASWLDLQPRKKHPAGETIPIYKDWRGARKEVGGVVAQVEETAQLLATDYLPALNEYGVGIVLNACRGRRSLNHDPDSAISHFQLLQLALERAKTAREAILVMGFLVEQHGFLDVGPFPTGKNIGVIDSEEAWWFDVPGGRQWVAVRVPDNAVSGNANRFWLGEIDPGDDKNVMASRELISFAIERGWHTASRGGPFDFTEAYGDKDWGDLPSSRRIYSTLREWRIACIASGEAYSPPAQGAEWEGPHVVIPRVKLGLEAVYRIMRDHYEGTVYDTRRPENGGDGRGCPHPPLLIPTPYPRPIDMFNTQMSYVVQSRSVNGRPCAELWFAVHSPSTGCYVPFSPLASGLHPAYATGAQGESAFWRQFDLNLLIRHDWGRLAPRVRDVYDRLERSWIEHTGSTEIVPLSGRAPAEDLPGRITDHREHAAQEALEACERLTQSIRAELAERMMAETLDGLLEGRGA